MFPFPQAPYGGSGGMTANQIQQPMTQQPTQAQQSPPGCAQANPLQSLQKSNTPYTYGAGGPQQLPGAAQSQLDPQQLAALRMLLQQQQQPGSNLRSMLGL